MAHIHIIIILMMMVYLLYLISNNVGIIEGFNHKSNPIQKNKIKLTRNYIVNLNSSKQFEENKYDTLYNSNKCRPIINKRKKNHIKLCDCGSSGINASQYFPYGKCSKNDHIF